MPSPIISSESKKEQNIVPKCIKFVPRAPVLKPPKAIVVPPKQIPIVMVPQYPSNESHIDIDSKIPRMNNSYILFENCSVPLLMNDDVCEQLLEEKNLVLSYFKHPADLFVCYRDKDYLNILKRILKASFGIRYKFDIVVLPFKKEDDGYYPLRGTYSTEQPIIEPPPEITNEPSESLHDQTNMGLKSAPTKIITLSHIYQIYGLSSCDPIFAKNSKLLFRKYTNLTLFSQVHNTTMLPKIQTYMTTPPYHSILDFENPDQFKRTNQFELCKTAFHILSLMEAHPIFQSTPLSRSLPFTVTSYLDQLRPFLESYSNTIKPHCALKAYPQIINYILNEAFGINYEKDTLTMQFVLDNGKYYPKGGTYTVLK